MKRVILLNQCTLDPAYRQQIAAIDETWGGAAHPRLQLIHYYGHSGKHDRSIDGQGNRLVIGIDDRREVYRDMTGRPQQFDSRGEKFILALTYCLDHFDFDFIYRVSCTSYIHLGRAYDYIASLEEHKVYNGCRNLKDHRYRFVSGFHCIMSRDTVEHLVRHKNLYLSLRQPEDVATGLIVMHLSSSGEEPFLQSFDSQDQSTTHLMVRDRAIATLDLERHTAVFNFKCGFDQARKFHELHHRLHG